MLTAAGSGYSLWQNLAVTRWREDVTQDGWGSYLYLRDVRTGKVWSAGYQPTVTTPTTMKQIFVEDRVRITRTDGSLSCSLEIVVSPVDDAEIRRLSLTNNGMLTREIEITSYAEIVLAPFSADIAHPAFSNLFINTDYLHSVRGLIAGGDRVRTATRQSGPFTSCPVAKPAMACNTKLTGHALSGAGRHCKDPSR